MLSLSWLGTLCVELLRSNGAPSLNSSGGNPFLLVVYFITATPGMNRNHIPNLERGAGINITSTAFSAQTWFWHCRLPHELLLSWDCRCAKCRTMKPPRTAENCYNCCYIAKTNEQTRKGKSKLGKKKYGIRPPTGQENRRNSATIGH